MTSPIAVGDLDGFFHRQDENLAVANVVRSWCGPPPPGIRWSIEEVIVHGDLERDLAEQISFVFVAAVRFDLAALPRVAIASETTAWLPMLCALVRLRRREARHAGHSRIDLQRRQRDGAHGPAHVLRDGADGVFFRSLAGCIRGSGPLPPQSRSVRHGRCYSRLSGTFEQLFHVRGVRELDIRRARRGQCLRAAPPPPPTPPRPFRVPGYPVTPALFIAAAAAIAGTPSSPGRCRP